MRQANSPHTIDTGRTTEVSRIQIQTEASQLLITIKPSYWSLGFSISPLMSTLTTKTQSLNFESKTHEAQLEDQKPKKSSRMSSRRKKKPQNQQMVRKAANQRKGWEKLKTQAQTQNSP
jgi:nicotinic acid phosphoribosyltransferase